MIANWDRWVRRVDEAPRAKIRKASGHVVINAAVAPEDGSGLG